MSKNKQLIFDRYALACSLEDFLLNLKSTSESLNLPSLKVELLGNLVLINVEELNDELLNKLVSKLADNMNDLDIESTLPLSIIDDNKEFFDNKFDNHRELISELLNDRLNNGQHTIKKSTENNAAENIVYSANISDNLSSGVRKFVNDISLHFGNAGLPVPQISFVHGDIIIDCDDFTIDQKKVATRIFNKIDAENIGAFDGDTFETIDIPRNELDSKIEKLNKIKELEVVGRKYGLSALQFKAFDDLLDAQIKMKIKENSF